MNCIDNMKGICTHDPFDASTVYVAKYSDGFPVIKLMVDKSHQVNTVNDDLCINIDCKRKRPSNYSQQFDRIIKSKGGVL